MHPLDDLFIGYVIANTNNALFFRDHYWNEARWVPKSQCKVYPTPDHVGETHISISKWLCSKNGWSEFTEMRGD